MSLTVHLPRLGLLARTHRKPKHSAPAEVERLRAENARVRTLLDGAHQLIAGLQMREAEALAKQGDAEEIVVQQLANIEDLRAERDELLAEVLKFRARFGPQMAAEANANRVTVPPMVRPISGPEEEATAPIDVRPLWAARDAGLLGPVTDPGHITA
jgi:hypothetical protein